jgi:LysM repeat protein
MVGITSPDNLEPFEVTDREQKMKQKEKPASKIPTTQTNTNRKKRTDNGAGPWGIKTALFKMNDTTLIIAGALVVTLVVFFVFFFGSSGSGTDTVSSSPDDTRFQPVETRLAEIGQSLADLETKLNASPRTNVNTELAEIRKQLSTLESGILVRMESLDRRVGRLEEMPKTASAGPPPSAQDSTRVVTVNPDIQEKKALEKPSAAARTGETAQLFHTVEKGETLWRISQKYDTTVDRLRQLNNLAPGADIYQGSKIRVR